MITNTLFNRYKNRFVHNGHWIVEVTDGTTTWLLTETLNLTFDEGTTLPLLMKAPVIKEQVDFYNKKWAVSDMVISISNAPYKIDNAVPPTSTDKKIRLSDEFSGTLVGKTVKAYYLIGRTSTLADPASQISLSTVMKRFEGVIIEHPEYTERTITLKVADKGRVSHKTLPQLTMKDGLDGAGGWNFACENPDVLMPLVWGVFDYNPDDLSGVGLCEGVRYNSTQHIFSARPVHSIQESWFKMDSLNALSQYLSPTMEESYLSSFGRINPRTNSQSYAYIKPINVQNEGIYFVTGDMTWDNEENVLGYEITEYMNLTDSYDATNANGYLFFALPDFAGGDALTNENGIGIQNNFTSYIDILFDSSNYAAGDAFMVYFMYEKNTSSTNSTYPLRLSAGSYVVHTDYPNYDSVAINPRQGLTNGGDFATNVGWHFESGHDSPNYGDREKTLIVVEAVRPGGHDSTNNNLVMAEIYDIRMRLAFLPHWPNIKNYYVACNGFMYGSWITGRSSNYASGDVIEDPAGIIEDILRTELGYVDDDIDMPTFINAENTSLKHKINIRDDNKIKSDDLIKKICEQTPYAFYMSGAGKARLIKLDDSSPTTNRKIQWSHIKQNTLKVGKHKWIINTLEHRTRYQLERDEYMDIATTTNSTSVTNYGERLYKANWEYIVDSASTLIMTRHLIDTNYQGLWANPKTKIEMVLHAGYANMEVGDWIEIDSEYTDYQILCHGESWSGKQFIIDSLEISNNGVRITALELF